MEQDVIPGLPLLVMAAFIALVFGLALLARQLHRLHKPVIVRRGAGQPASRQAPPER
ncbi:hypothetical protein G4G28_09425 [Massilia sp. Dwa41.01b]|uniref:hypothetical protein n=1 Tax=Massilia sp. Dwa41.01b TaxID=2709302 RepID=UPI0015FF4D35|nr:hypothetical protein [Massilia sp. Dwa41.01b]QNA88651.1 hypothetical protein G4G28_09425 [Massilia sp. Dwa41.01b]